MNKYKIVSETINQEIMATDDFVYEIFAALCDFYGIDQDDMVGVYYEKGEFFSASAKFDINGKQHKITIKRDSDGNTL